MRRLILTTILILVLLAGLALNLLFARRVAEPSVPVTPVRGHGALMANIDLAGLSAAAAQERVEQVAQDGMTYLRLRLPWDEIQPEPETWRWRNADRVIAAARAQDLQVVLVLDGSPAWAREAVDGDNPLAPPHDVRDFGAFATAVAERYRGRISAYQIWDEPNIAPHWGRRWVEPRAYFHLLREGANSVHRADAEADIMLAAMAPTTADDGANMPDLSYLDQLYQLGAAEYFDSAAAAAYGFDQPPDAAPAPDQLNFRRPELIFGVMQAHGDAATPLWITSWGWWTPPPGVNPADSPWGSVPRAVLPAYQERGLHLANTRWPWSGPLAWAEYSTNRGDDPLRLGLAQRTPGGEHTLAGETLARLADESFPVGTGSHPAGSAAIRYQPDAWRTSPQAADPDQPGAELALSFEGGAVTVEVQGGWYWATLNAWIDGQPAPLLPKDNTGNAFIALHDPDNAVKTVILARNLEPGQHELRLRASGGWGQWPLRRIIIDHQSWPRPWPWLPITAVLLLALLVAGVLWMRAVRAPEGRAAVGWLDERWASLSEAYRLRVGRWRFPLLLLLAAAFYFAPNIWLSLLALIVLIFVLALDSSLAPALVLALLPFYMRPKHLGPIGFSLHELVIWLAVGLSLLRWLLARSHTPILPRLTGLDYPVLLLLFFGFFAALGAEHKGFAFYDFRTVFLAPALFYWLVVHLNHPRGEVRKPPPDFGGRLEGGLSDALVLGSLLISLIGLAQFVSGGAAIAEGVPRISALFGSANNLALYLGRVLPLLLSIVVLGSAPRRWLYLLALIPIAVAAFLTFSKGLLLISIPASLLLLAILQPRLRKAVGVLFILGILALLPFLGTTRFTDLLNTNSGTTFLRLQLWRSAWQMFLDHPWLGVGPDNFLYAYRSTYALPIAWEELQLSHPHNLFLDLLTRVGLLGFIAGIWLLAATLLSGFRLLRQYTISDIQYPYLLGLLVGLTAGLLHGLIDNSIFLVDLAILTAFVIAVVERLRREQTPTV